MRTVALSNGFSALGGCSYQLALPLCERTAVLLNSILSCKQVTRKLALVLPENTHVDPETEDETRVLPGRYVNQPW